MMYLHYCSNISSLSHLPLYCSRYLTSSPCFQNWAQLHIEIAFALLFFGKKNKTIKYVFFCWQNVKELPTLVLWAFKGVYFSVYKFHCELTL